MNTLLAPLPEQVDNLIVIVCLLPHSVCVLVHFASSLSHSFCVFIISSSSSSPTFSLPPFQLMISTYLSDYCNLMKTQLAPLQKRVETMDQHLGKLDARQEIKHFVDKQVEKFGLPTQPIRIQDALPCSPDELNPQSSVLSQLLCR